MSLEPVIQSAQKNLNEGNIETALLDLKTAKGMAPDDWRVAYLYGRCYLHTKEYEKAIENLKKAHAASPQPFVSYFLANAYVVNKDWQNAVQIADEALAKNPEDTTTKAALFYLKSGSHMEMGELDKAIEAAEKAVELVPDDKNYKTHLQRLKQAK